ncbi:carbon-nitrogen hydrolase family protein [Fodinicola acaciae]|uniref:carbon-nitrogen hydrolase family protein n=1 Tax=Fodinicola acaciae TaxID=2681555 RepID=UPI0013D12EFB|nr:carbon-nitrogen hydrolase family protein [Fodinicola acaciae]
MRVAIAQYGPGQDKTANLDIVAGYARRAAEAGADMLICPEAAMVDFGDDKEKVRQAAEPLDGPFVTGLRKLSAEHGVAVTIGIHETADTDDGRVYNTSVVASGGELAAYYRKLHLYDAFSAKESENIVPGVEDPATFRCAGLTVGLVTCYDLRFPEIFRDLVDRGADLFAVPAAWVRGPFKEAHWLSLLRARAIENTCYAIGSGKINDRCIGRSAAYDPMGAQLADLGEVPGMAVVEATAGRLADVREKLPSLAHRRYRVSLV